MVGRVRNPLITLAAAAGLAAMVPGAAAFAAEPDAGTSGPVAAAVDTARATGSTVLLPVLGYTPDTGLMLGGMALRFFYLEPEFEDARPSVFNPIFVYTLKNQIMIYLGVSLVGDGNRNELNVVPSYILFPDQFYGIGRDVDLDTDEEDYTSESVGVDLRYMRRVRGDWRLGLNGLLKKHRLDEVTPGGQLAGGAIVGTANTWLNALGPAVALDSRDNTWAPRRGLWLQAIARFAGGGLGSDYTMTELDLDLRGYRNLGPALVLAGQARIVRQTGEVPFFAMPRLGGDTGLRGYRGGLYRDRTCALARAELRRDRLWGQLGAVAFAGIGDVSPDPGDLTFAARLWTVGGGLRYMVDAKERVNIRLDVGLGNGDSGFFLSLGEAF
jgi:hypothetical protein